MRKLFVTLSVIFAVLGIVLTILPTEKLALIPIVLSVVLSFLALIKSDENQKKFPKWILVIALLTFFVSVGKQFLMKDEVVIDKQDEVKKVESVKEDKKDLEDLEGL
jgi:predicted membrane channel-forming protein YqfA (hemolysin III family)